MKQQKIIKKYWFFRSLFISFVLFMCLGTLFLGIGYCYCVMERNLTGKEIYFVEKVDREIKILGHTIISK